MNRLTYGEHGASRFSTGKDGQDLQREIRDFLIENGHLPNNSILKLWVENHHYFIEQMIADKRKSSERQYLVANMCRMLEEVGCNTRISLQAPVSQTSNSVADKQMELRV